jgi:hypothetical protein
MRALQVLGWTICASLLTGCFFTDAPPGPDPLRSLRGERTVPKSLSGIIDLNSDPPGAQATTSLGGGCQTPCSLEVTAEAPFTVTFTRQNYAPSEISVELQPAEPGVSNPKFAPNPVVAQLTPVAAQSKPGSGARNKSAPKQ